MNSSFSRFSGIASLVIGIALMALAFHVHSSFVFAAGMATAGIGVACNWPLRRR